jgi:hypothetical protein
MQQNGIMNYYHNYLIEKAMKDNTTTIDYGAAQPYNNITYSSGIDTITLSPSTYEVNSSLYNSTTITIPTGGYSIGAGSTTVPYTYTTTGTSFYQPDTTVQINADGMQIKEGGDIKIGGKSLSEAIDKIEERLGILNPNPELEERWDQLKELRKQYQELEKDLLEKEKIMKILKEA